MDLPENIVYWMTSTTKHDCYFNVGQVPGPIERVGAIKIMLIGQSEVFRNMLDSSALAEYGDITVTDSDPQTFKHFLKCVYGGSKYVLSQLSFEEIIKLLYLCEKYLVSEVKKEVSTYILRRHGPFTAHNVLIALSNPVSLCDEGLKQEIARFVQNNTDIIVNDKAFLNLDFNTLLFIAKQDRISIPEVFFWKAFLNWAQHKVDTGNKQKDIRSCLGNILKLIRFGTMKSEDLCKHVAPSAVLTSEEFLEICKSIGTKTTPNLKDLSNNMVSRFKKPRIQVMVTMVLNNIGDFSGTAFSSKVHSNGKFKWSFSVNKNDKYLEIFVYCKPISSTFDWKCQASVKLTIVNRFNRNNDLKISFDHLFCKKEDNQGYDQFFIWNELVDPKIGFVENKSIEVLVVIECDSD